MKKHFNNKTKDIVHRKNNVISHAANTTNSIEANKHIVPTIREWTNSVFYFNKNNFRGTHSKDQLANKIINSYFKLSLKPVKTIRSKRMRDLIKRSTTNQSYVSRSYIKQSTMKSIITIYLYDRQKNKSRKNLFFFNIALSRAIDNITNSLLASTKKTVTTFRQNVTPNIVNNNTARLKHLFTFKSKLNAVRYKKHLGYNSIVASKKSNKLQAINLARYLKRRNELNKLSVNKTNSNINLQTFVNKLISYILNRKNAIKSIFYYCFFKWILSLINLKTIILYKGDYIIHNKQSIWIDNVCLVVYSKNSFINNIDNKGYSYKLLHVNSNYKLYRLGIKKNLNVKNIIYINSIMYRNICIYLFNLYKTNNINLVKSKLYILYVLYYNKFYKVYKRKFFRKLSFIIKSLYKLHANNMKLKQLLPGLKVLLNNIYNKNIELNIVKLKYSILNSDIFTQAIVIKLRKRKANLMKLIKGSLKLLKLPNKIHIDNIKQISENAKTDNAIFPLDKIRSSGYTTSSLSLFEKKKSIKENTLKVLSSIYSNKYFVSTVNNKHLLNQDIYNNIKYKWVTGINIESKGRLSRRYTASRSVFKTTIKGNLKNLDYMNKSMIDVKNNKSILSAPKIQMVGNTIKPNIQYSLKNSKRRIGAFGIKGWINSN